MLPVIDVGITGNIFLLQIDFKSYLSDYFSVNPIIMKYQIWKRNRSFDTAS